MKNIDWSKNGAKLKPQYADIVVALDIGTSKIAAVVAEIKEDDQYEVIGLGSSTSQGMKKGVVVNIESTVSAIQRALEEAELMADQKIKEVWTASRVVILKGLTHTVWWQSKVKKSYKQILIELSKRLRLFRSPRINRFYMC